MYVYMSLIKVAANVEKKKRKEKKKGGGGGSVLRLVKE